jgi:hypothetical protein
MAVGRPRDLRNAAWVQLGFFLPAVLLGAWLGGIAGVAIAADAMVVVGIWRLHRALRESVDFSLRRLARWPVVALGLASTAGFLIERAAPADAPETLVLKLVAFLALFGGVLVLAEGGDYLRGGRELVRIVRQSRSPVA